MAAISYVFTITRVAEVLGEDEDWLRELAIGMEPEDGRIYVHGIDDESIPAFTYGIECLKEIIDELRATGRAPRPKGNE